MQALNCKLFISMEVFPSGLHHDRTVRLLNGALNKKRSNFPKRTSRGPHSLSVSVIHKICNSVLAISLILRNGLFNDPICVLRDACQDLVQFLRRNVSPFVSSLNQYISHLIDTVIRRKCAMYSCLYVRFK
jgi:hypothetical protein